MSLEQLPSEILRHVSLSLDRHAIWALCLTSVQFHRDFQPSLLTAKGSLDRAYKWSAKHGDVALFRQVLQRGKYRNLSALCLAAKHGNLAIVDELLQGCDDNTRKALLTGATKENKSWGHPLAAAVKAGHEAVVNRLLELEGMNVDMVNRQDCYHTPLDRAVRGCNSKMLETFVEKKVNLTPERAHNPFPIIAALVKRRYSAVRRLHAVGGADNISLDAWIRASEDVMQANYFDPTSKDPKGLEPLRLLFAVAPQLAAAGSYQLELAAALGLDTLKVALQTRPDLSGPEYSRVITHIVCDEKGVFHATASEKVEICKILMECGASLNEDNSDEAPWYEHDIIEMACDNFVALELLEYLFTLPDCPTATKALRSAKSTEIVQFLLDKGADVHEYNNEFHMTALFSILERGPLEKVPKAVEWHQPMGEGAAYQDWRKSIELLIDHGADVSLIQKKWPNCHGQCCSWRRG